ncbi:phosphoethanolamine transferase [Dokdonia sinensis]|nr:phosphoethanolamine transferase [Dokdonia sinensis]
MTFKEQFLPYRVIQVLGFYESQKALLDAVSVTPNGNFTNTIHNSENDQEVYVVVIGESTTRDHMSLYNYYRDTNPLLGKRQDELLIYNDVISPHTHTITSLGKMLTLGDYDIPEKKYNSTVVQLFNNVGFGTYWISNQRPMGIYETSTSIISRQSDTSIFTDVSEGSLDEKVLKPLKKVLNKKDDKKFIVIHLMGTHVSYHRRYPEQYDLFKNEPKTQFRNENAYKSINEYDNAVLYNDYIVNEIIASIETEQLKSFVIYLSDHGEEVYQTLNMSGHLEEEGSKPMYDVPFLLWRSEKYLLDNKKLVFDVNRPYTLEHFIHTLAELSDIQFDGLNVKNSLVSPKFENSERLISKKGTYEETFCENQ